MKKILLTLIPGALLGTFLHAQDATADEQDIIELSPFVVEASEDVGYMATNTLAGTRLKTQLKEVGAAVSVYTGEFLEDIDATDIEDILTYTTSTEGGGIDGNYSSISGRNDDEVRGNPSAINRVRALSNATRTRNYFESALPSDGYNFSSVTISRGPNAVLAGIGSAGGIIDAALEQAVFRDSTRIEFRYSEHNSHREEFHWNRVLIDDFLAFRIDAMHEDRNFRQEPAFEKDRRIYMATTVKLRKNNPKAFWGATTIRANAEFGQIEGIPPTTLTPDWSMQSWFPGTDPRDGEPYEAPYWSYNGATRTTLDADGNEIANNLTIPGFPLFRNVALVFADPSSPEANMNLPGDLAGIQGHQGTIPGGAGSPRGALRSTGDLWRNGEDDGFQRTRLFDRKIFDFYKNLISGKFDSRAQDFEAVDIRMDQLLMNGNAGFEIAYNYQYFEQMRDLPVRGQDEISIDTNSILSVRTDAFNTGGALEDQFIPNPNYGRPFIVTRDAFRDQTNVDEFESFQASAFVKKDFTNSDSWLGRLLGRHTLSGLFFETTQFTSNRGYSSTWAGGDLDMETILGAVPGQGAGLRVNGAFYIGDSLVGVEREEDVRLTPITSNRPVIGQTYTLRVWDPEARQFVTGTSTPQRILTTARDQREEVESVALALQSFFLDDHIVTLFGWREDSSDAFTSSDPSPLADGNLDMSDFRLFPASSQTKESLTKSVVVKFPEAYLFDLPFDSDLRFYWNTSENFDPVGQRRNVWNEEVGSPDAETEEYGIMLSLFDGKLDLRVNRFETTINNVNVRGDVAIDNPFGYINTMINRMVNAHNEGLTPQDPSLDPLDEDGLAWSNGPNSFQTFEEVARAFYESIPLRMQANIGPENNFEPRFEGTGDSFAYIADNVTGVASLSDVVSEGWEYELVWNPTRAWRISLNAAKNEAVLASIAKEEVAFSEAWLERAGSIYNGDLLNIHRQPNSNDGAWMEQYRSSTVRQNITQAALSGQKTPEIRKWRVNLVTRYRFMDGFLEGFNVTGAVRWQDKIGIGYPLITGLDGSLIGDVDNPYYGDDQLSIDLGVGYGTTFKAFGQKIDWTVRLNVRNAFADDELIPIIANADGSIGTARIPPERTWSISNSFRF
ncbi:hypothetical protein G0Q06_03365 [Puniceicoccales bacterium CK1056]|uniref:TonB-dependent receptor plug domain-containing protein n=1 Tax=Oceanipulchritudo coccoides TaxID=2706888 RepID=A0A6B2LZ92_9BACT|nr:TonB-dependent receptor plug domain-containing protein [Oceanipulchritudo coccoides]NDV61482.1 hypothetical protein [Oceanipulchritudo coccoides]